MINLKLTKKQLNCLYKEIEWCLFYKSYINRNRELMLRRLKKKLKILMKVGDFPQVIEQNDEYCDCGNKLTSDEEKRIKVCKECK